MAWPISNPSNQHYCDKRKLCDDFAEHLRAVCRGLRDVPVANDSTSLPISKLPCVSWAASIVTVRPYLHWRSSAANFRLGSLQPSDMKAEFSKF